MLQHKDSQIPMSPLDMELSKQYREQMVEIMNTFKSLSGFTDNLQDKVDYLLRKQQQEFFKAYKAHFIKIRQEVLRLQNTVAEQQRKIADYENEGALSIMIKKSNALEKELVQMYQKMEAKDKIMQELRIQVKLLEQQQEKLQRHLKDSIRDKRLDKIVKEEEKNQIDEALKQNISVMTEQKVIETETNIFATEIDQKNSRPTKQTNVSLQNLAHIKSFNSQKDLSVEKRHVDLIKKRFEGEIHRLKRKNNELLNTNVKAMSLHNEMSLFFISCVQEIKKDICTRNRIPYCDLEDFKKQDKLNILLSLLENQQIISLIHQKLFAAQTQSHSVFEKVRNKSLFDDTTRRSRHERSYRDIDLLEKEVPPINLPPLRKLRNKSPKIHVKNGRLNFEPY